MAEKICNKCGAATIKGYTNEELWLCDDCYEREVFHTTNYSRYDESQDESNSYWRILLMRHEKPPWDRESFD